MSEREGQSTIRYSAPPITEAVVELRFVDSISPAQIKRLADKVARFYPTEVEEGVIGVQVNAKAHVANFVDETRWRKRSSKDQTELLLIKPNAFGWSQLAPYTSWADFRARIARDFDILAKTKMRRLARVGMRYINRIDVPAVPNPLGQYRRLLNAEISMPANVPLPDNYRWRYETLFSDPRCRAIIQSGSAEPVLPGTAAMLLDIDLGVEPPPAKKSEIFPLLDRLRILKNTLFEAMITDQVRESFNP